MEPHFEDVLVKGIAFSYSSFVIELLNLFRSREVAGVTPHLQHESCIFVFVYFLRWRSSMRITAPSFALVNESCFKMGRLIEMALQENSSCTNKLDLIVQPLLDHLYTRATISGITENKYLHLKLS